MALAAPPPIDRRRTRAAPSPFSSLRSRNFRLFLGGQFVSLCGSLMSGVAHGWLVLQLSNSAFTVGLVSTLSSLPILLFTLYGGVLADRVDKRRTVFALQLAMLAEALLLAVLTAGGWITVPGVMVLAAIFGLLTAFEVPMRQALFADLVRRQDLPNAIALNSAAFNVARVVGPAFAGVVIATLGIAACFFLNAASFVAVLWGLRAMRLPTFVPKPQKSDALQSFREGFRYLFGTPWPRTLMLLTAALVVFSYCFLTMLPVFARDALRLGAGGFGAITAAVGVGAALAALGVAAGGTRIRHARLAAWSSAAFGAVLLAVSTAPTLWVALPLLVLAGMLVAFASVSTNTFLQQQVPDGLRGRIMGFYSFVVLGLVPFGSLQAGWVAEHFGVRASFGFSGAAALVCGLVVVVTRRGREGW